MARIRTVTRKSGEVVYEISVFKGRDANGKQDCCSTTWKPKPAWSPRTVKKELEAFARDFERDCKEGKILTKAERKQRQKEQEEAAARVVTFRRYVKETYLPRKAATLSIKTIDAYTRIMDRFFVAFGDTPMPDIRPVDITSFFISMQTTDTAKRATKSGSVDTGKPLSHKTVIKYYTILNNLFHCAYMDDVVQVNPMDKVERPRPRKDEAPHEAEALSVTDAQRLLECLKKEPLQWQAIIGLMLDSGCRRGEAVGLKWKSVHFASNTIVIENNLQRTTDKGLYDTTPKGKKSRTVDIASAVMVLLKQVKASQRITTMDGYCFTNRDGKPISPDTVTRYLTRINRKSYFYFFLFMLL